MCPNDVEQNPLLLVLSAALRQGFISRILIKDDSMRLEKCRSLGRQFVSALVAGAFVVIGCLGSTSDAQAQSSDKSTTAKQASSQQPNAEQPYVLSTRVHLQTGTNKGYLVVRVDLAEGCYVYSLTQKGDARPTKLTVTPSPKIRLLGGFAADRAAEVAAGDTAKQRLEIHKTTVQFFAPVEVAAGTDLSSLAVEVAFDGQVCTADKFCMPIMSEKVAGKFAGYFQAIPENQSNDSYKKRSAQLNSSEATKQR